MRAATRSLRLFLFSSVSDISTHTVCQSSPGNSLGKYSPRWRCYGERGFGGAGTISAMGRGGRRSGEEKQRGTKPSTTEGRGRRGEGCTIESEIDNSSVGAPPGLPAVSITPRRYRRCRVCKLSTIGDARIYRAYGWPVTSRDYTCPK